MRALRTRLAVAEEATISAQRAIALWGGEGRAAALEASRRCLHQEVGLRAALAAIERGLRAL